MKVRDVMTTDVVTVEPGVSLREVAAILVDRRISGLPVVDEEGKVLGVVSEGDLLFKERGPTEQRGVLSWFAENWRAKPDARTAGEAMTAPAVTIAPWRQVSGAAAQMLDAAVNRLPVVEDDGRLVGIVTRADLVRAFVRPDAAIEEEIRDEVLARELLLEVPGAVSVAVEGGKVTLSGTVPTRTEAELAVALVAKVPGVIELESSITWREDDTKRRAVSPVDAGLRLGI
jgi:CBS domain-containing protein